MSSQASAQCSRRLYRARCPQFLRRDFRAQPHNKSRQLPCRRHTRAPRRCTAGAFEIRILTKREGAEGSQARKRRPDVYDTAGRRLRRIIVFCRRKKNTTPCISNVCRGLRLFSFCHPGFVYLASYGLLRTDFYLALHTDCRFA